MKAEFVQKFNNVKKGLESPHASGAMVKNVIGKIADEFVSETPDDETEIRMYLKEQEDFIIEANAVARQLYGYTD